MPSDVPVPDSMRCWLNRFAPEKGECPKEGRWKMNPSNERPGAPFNALLVMMVWCDEHRNRTDVPIEEVLNGDS